MKTIHCPYHEDAHPSMVVNEANGKGVCMAGCPPVTLEELSAKLGVPLEDVIASAENYLQASAYTLGKTRLR